MFAFLLTLFSEAPMVTLETILFKKPQSKAQETDKKQAKIVEDLQLEPQVKSTELFNGEEVNTTASSDDVRWPKSSKKKLVSLNDEIISQKDDFFFFFKVY